VTADNNHFEQLDPALGGDRDPTVDEHRFSSEAGRPKSSKRLLMIFGVLAFFLAVIGVGGFLAKTTYARHMAERSEKTRVEREKTAAETVRKGKQFAAEAPPAAAPASSALPVGFGQPKGSQKPVEPIPLAGTSAEPPPVPARPPAPVQPRKRSMMLADLDATTEVKAETSTAPSLPALAAAAATPAPASLPLAPAPMHGTVQDMAKAQAAKSPISGTNQSNAARLGDRSMLLARGSYVPCVLETDLNSNVPGPTSCIVTSNVYSDDGKVVLIDKGARVQGEYRNTLKQGDTRIAVLWNRIKTPLGIVVDVDSPATDGTGAAGVAGEINNHWMQRIGAAFLLSLVQDVVESKTRDQEGGGTVINTSSTSKSMSEKVLESTINIPPTLTRSRGERLMIMVNRDLWFDSVYTVGKKR
jgi:type IV secretion system protein VirB10